jgi:signal transduction histidine kinase
MDMLEPYGPITLLSTLPASASQRRTALVVSVVLVVALLATLPFAQVAFPGFPGFVVAQQSVLFASELVTAILLFGQYAIQPTRELLALAAGYLFTALLLIPHTLTFPGAFAEEGLLNAGSQTTAWIYLVWRAVLPLAVVVYALREKPDNTIDQPTHRVTLEILSAVSTVVVVVVAVVLTTVAGHVWLPELIIGGRFTALARFAVATVLGLTIAALISLLRRRPLSVLDLWLLVVMLAWACAAALSSLVSTGRYDVGFYAGRFYAVLASCIVLAVLLTETTTLYAQVIRTTTLERAERELRLEEMEAVLVHLARVSELAQIVSALIHEVNQPLAAISNYVRAGVRMANTGNVDGVMQALERSREQIDRASSIVRRLRHHIAKRQSNRQLVDVEEMLRDAVRLALVGTGRDAPPIEIACDPSAASAMFDRIQIEQVVFNLVRNAVEAMVRTPRRKVSIGATLTSDGMVEVSIADTGPGLSPIIRDKLFQPFHTTKADGLGIGLSICHAIVDAHGGQLLAQDNPGGGTVFRFTLPRQTASA